MFKIKKVFSTAAILLLAASSQSAAAEVTLPKAEKPAPGAFAKAEKPAPGASAKAEKKSCAGNLAQELLIKLTLARQFAIQFVGLYSLGDDDGDIEDAELDNLVELVAEATGLPEAKIRSIKAIQNDGEVTIDETTAGVLKAWNNTCAAEMKEMLDGVILPSIAGYNADFVLTGADDEDDA